MILDTMETTSTNTKRRLRHVGTIMTLVHDKQFGFIADEQDLCERFFYASWINDNGLKFEDLSTGQRVTFLPISSENGDRAINIRRVRKDKIE